MNGTFSDCIVSGQQIKQLIDHTLMWGCPCTSVFIHRIFKAPFRPPKPLPPEMTILPETHQKDMNNMLKNQFYADLVIVCGSLRFHVHRFMITAGSQAFNRLLNIDFSDMGARSSSESSVVSSTYGDNVNNTDFNEETEYLIRCDQSKMPQTRYVCGRI